MIDNDDLEALASLIAAQIAEAVSGETIPASPSEIAAAVSAAILPALYEIPEDTVDALGERLG